MSRQHAVLHQRVGLIHNGEIVQYARGRAIRIWISWVHRIVVINSDGYVPPILDTIIIWKSGDLMTELG